MADYRIKIDVAAEAKEQADQARRGGPSPKDEAKRGIELSKGIRDLVGAVNSLKKEVVSLQKVMGKPGGAGAPPAPPPRQPSGGGGSGGMSQAWGSIKSSIPGLDLLLGGAGWLINATQKMGEAHMATAGAQRTSAGLGGVQAGNFGYLVGGEYGEYIKGRRQQSGRITAGDTEMGALSQKYMKTFGAGGGEMGALLGNLDVGTKGKGSEQLEKAIQSASQYGVTTQLKSMVDALGGVMKEAVEDGVNASDLASDMADQMGHLQAFSTNRTISQAIKAVQSQAGVQKEVGRGKFGGAAGFETYQATQDIVGRDLETGGGYAQELINEGLVSTEEAKRFKKTGNMDARTLQAATTFVSQKQPKEARELALGRVFDRVGGGVGTLRQQQAQVITGMQNGVFDEFGLQDTTAAMQAFRAHKAKQLGITGEGGNVSRGSIDKLKGDDREYAEMLFRQASTAKAESTVTPTGGNKFLEEGEGRGGAAFMQAGRDIQRNSLALSEASAKAADALMTVETAMAEMSKNSDLAVTAMKTMGNVAKGFAEVVAGMDKFFDGIQKKIDKIKKGGSFLGLLTD